MVILDIFNDFASLFFPRLCAACNTSLNHNEHFICTSCRLDLPFTNFHTDAENDVAKTFWGRVPVENATALLHYNKKGLVQTLLHKLKYKGYKEIGFELGKLAGYELINTHFHDVDIIVPVPLHKARKRKRGYNQSEYYANGIAEVWGKTVNTTTLIRVVNNRTQTKKHRYERWENTIGLFELIKQESFADKHILLVDDVITTGATLEGCILAILVANNCKVSVLTIARA